MINNANNSSPVETKADFARRLGVNRSTVTRGVQQDRILVNGAGLVYINESLKRWNDTKAGRFDVEARHAQNRGQTIPYIDTDAFLSDELDIEQATGEIATYKAKALEAKNQMALLQVATEKGEMMLKTDHITAAAKVGANLRQAIERMIDNLAPQLANADRSTIQSQINQSTTSTLEQVL